MHDTGDGYPIICTPIVGDFIQLRLLINSQLFINSSFYEENVNGSFQNHYYVSILVFDGSIPIYDCSIAMFNG